MYNQPLVYIDPSGHFAWLAVGLVGGLIGGAIYGYGSQVANNLNQGMSLGDALTTNIDPGQVALYAGTGAVIGTGVGALGGLAAGVITGAASGQTVATASTVTTVACSDGDCTNGISTLTQADLPAVQQFVQEAIDINNARGMVSSGPTWEWLSRTMLSASNQARMFMARAGERITGMMQVKYTSEGYTIQQLEGLGSGAGTSLFKQAIQDSIAQGYGGSISLIPAQQAIKFYAQFPGYVILADGTWYWSAEAAKAILAGQ